MEEFSHTGANKEHSGREVLPTVEEISHTVGSAGSPLVTGSRSAEEVSHVRIRVKVVAIDAAGSLEWELLASTEVSDGRGVLVDPDRSTIENESEATGSDSDNSHGGGEPREEGSGRPEAERLEEGPRCEREGGPEQPKTRPNLEEGRREDGRVGFFFRLDIGKNTPTGEMPANGGR